MWHVAGRPGLGGSPTTSIISPLVWGTKSPVQKKDRPAEGLGSSHGSAGTAPGQGAWSTRSLRAPVCKPEVAADLPREAVDDVSYTSSSGHPAKAA